MGHGHNNAQQPLAVGTRIKGRTVGSCIKLGEKRRLAHGRRDNDFRRRQGQLIEIEERGGAVCGWRAEIPLA